MTRCFDLRVFHVLQAACDAQTQLAEIAVTAKNGGKKLKSVWLR